MTSKKNQGFTLIELLVTLLLASVLLLALGASMSAITRSQSLVDDYEEIQETLRFTTAMLSRSLRTANSLVSGTSSEQLVISRTMSGQRIACNGADAAILSESFQETYFLGENDDKGKLMCKVDDEDPVTLAYGIEKIKFECMEYNPSLERRFRLTDENPEGDLVVCGTTGLDHPQIIAVKTTITFDKSEFRQLKSEYEHSFVTTLRTNLASLVD